MKALIQKLVGIGMILSALPVHAGDEGRCSIMNNGGVISYDAAAESNKWGVDCGFLTATAAALYNADHKYAIYAGNNGSFLITNTPKTGTPCNVYAFLKKEDIKVVGACSAGCYPPEQELEFGSRPVSIEHAFRSDARTVTALSSASEIGGTTFSEQLIESFVSGETNETLYTLIGQGSERLVVTGEHPMVSADGSLVPARRLRAGDALLGKDGGLIELAEVATRPYKGWVWNVRPQSRNKLDNILVAQGFLTGSVRFQNEWANETYRLTLRDSLDVTGL